MHTKEKEMHFKSVYDIWLKPIFNYLYYKTGDRDLSEDYVQEVFVKYWEKLPTIEFGKEKSYLYTTAKNLIINNSEHKKVVLKFERQLQVQPFSSSPHFDLEMKEFKERLEHAISELSEGEKEVFLMHRIDGFKYKEIAEMLSLSQKAVEKRMHNALLKLRVLCNNI